MRGLAGPCAAGVGAGVRRCRCQVRGSWPIAGRAGRSQGRRAQAQVPVGGRRGAEAAGAGAGAAAAWRRAAGRSSGPAEGGARGGPEGGPREHGHGDHRRQPGLRLGGARRGGWRRAPGPDRTGTLPGGLGRRLRRLRGGRAGGRAAPAGVAGPAARRAGAAPGPGERPLPARPAAGGRAEGRRGPLPDARRPEQLHGGARRGRARRGLPRLRGPARERAEGCGPGRGAAGGAPGAGAGAGGGRSRRVPRAGGGCHAQGLCLRALP
mmetsp:Transcript_1783/g.5636  ORF Transcript_1783/g.5636 Transcript_1783/m.5636 type:complete len:266 (-) Transcript_1783:473-1270(-)